MTYSLLRVLLISNMVRKGDSYGELQYACSSIIDLTLNVEPYVNLRKLFREEKPQMPCVVVSETTTSCIFIVHDISRDRDLFRDLLKLIVVFTADRYRRIKSRHKKPRP